MKRVISSDTTQSNRVEATLLIKVAMEFYDNETSEETVRYCVEQDLEDAGVEVIDVQVADTSL